MSKPSYIGRFAPSPTGPLHAGSLVAAMASYLDAKAHQGLWLVRIEDIDEARTVPGADQQILETLQLLGMQWDGEVVWQTQRKDLYQAAYQKLNEVTYACACSRREIADSQLGVASDGAAVYPGTCRNGLPSGRTARAFRVRVPDLGQANEAISFNDLWSGVRHSHLSNEVGDFVLKRADGYWAYQLAVVVDDAQQHVTHVVRGADLIDSTARQIYLQRLLGVASPEYMHVPVVTNNLGEKLSKQTGASELDVTNPIQTLIQAAQFLGLEVGETASVPQFWDIATEGWRQLRGI